MIFIKRCNAMPIYEFKCPKCGTEFEDLVANRGDSAPCPSCGCKKVERRISVPAPHQSKGSANIPSCSDGTCHLSPHTCGSSCNHD
ncbi:MAG TPA: zinc ribbon domain-containing protein [Firmicutes bacterium]|nr:zinc ribbon domain-containing protein [Bacillota bacterium]